MLLKVFIISVHLVFIIFNRLIKPTLRECLIFIILMPAFSKGISALFSSKILAAEDINKLRSQVLVVMS